MEEKEKIGKGAISVRISIKVGDDEYQLDGNALPVRCFKKPQVGKGAIPVELHISLEDGEYTLKDKAKLRSRQ